jgi:hypothetical protein
VLTPLFSTDHPFAPVKATNLEDSEAPSWQVGWEPRWIIQSGRAWSSALDVERDEVVLTNGRSGLLSWDGRRLRRRTADVTSELAKTLASELEEDPLLAVKTYIHAENALYMRPPEGRFLAAWSNRLVVANLLNDSHALVYSGPAALNNVWPRLYRTYVSDRWNNPISGVAALREQLFIFTPSSIHSTGWVEGISGHQVLGTREVTTKAGFASHFCVAPVAFGDATVLIGANADGIGIFTGSEVIQIVDGWDRVLDGGVNASLLRRTVGVAWIQKGWFLCAVPSAGSEKLDRVLAVDYMTRTVWPWSTPFGITSMAVHRGRGGEETVLFGTDDGFVQILADDATDDGKTFTGRCRTAPFRPFKTHEFEVLGLMVTQAEQDSAASMAVKLYPDRSKAAHTSRTYTIPATATKETAIGTMGFESHAAPGAFSDERWRTKRVGVPAGQMRGHTLQLEVSASRPWSLQGIDILATQRGEHG